jgi:hypothetical protein
MLPPPCEGLQSTVSWLACLVPPSGLRHSTYGPGCPRLWSDPTRRPLVLRDPAVSEHDFDDLGVGVVDHARLWSSSRPCGWMIMALIASLLARPQTALGGGASQTGGRATDRHARRRRMVTGGPEQILARGGNDSGRFTRSIVIRMQAAGRSLAVIRAAVDNTHGRYGPPTGTPRPLSSTSAPSCCWASPWEAPG